MRKVIDATMSKVAKYSKLIVISADDTAMVTTDKGAFQATVDCNTFFNYYIIKYSFWDMNYDEEDGYYAVENEISLIVEKGTGKIIAEDFYDGNEVIL